MAEKTVPPAGAAPEWALTNRQRNELARKSAAAAQALREVLAPLREGMSRQHVAELVRALAEAGPGDAEGLALTVRCIERAIRRERKTRLSATVLHLVPRSSSPMAR